MSRGLGIIQRSVLRILASGNQKVGNLRRGTTIGLTCEIFNLDDPLRFKNYTFYMMHWNSDHDSQISSVNRAVKSLERKGLIEKKPGYRRLKFKCFKSGLQTLEMMKN